MKARLRTFFDLGSVVHLPGRRPLGLMIVLGPEALYAVGILKKIVDIISDAALPIVHLSFSAPRIGEPIAGIIVVDATSAEERVRMVAEKIREIETVREVKLVEPLLADTLVMTPFDEYTIEGKRAVILRKNFYEGLIKWTWNMFGTGGGAMLYYIGTAIGKRVFEDHFRRASGDIGKLRAINEALFKAMGFGTLRIVSLDLRNKYATLRIENNFECELFMGRGESSSNLVRGMLNGWFSSLFKTDVRIIETRCIARGDPYCEFVVTVA
ncbi:MAG: hypothetical protein DRJ59_01580 [Thermoprotei archaeon]|nr:MAG: hypothetical protein DRJ59_01580 [Thermoprotei archaeon]